MGNIHVSLVTGPSDMCTNLCSFLCCHLEANDHNIPRRNAQYRTILSSLIFRSSDPLAQPAQIFETSHLFVMGDLNYRLSRLPSTGYPTEGKMSNDMIALEKQRDEMVEIDTLRKEQREGRVFGGLREGDLTRFAPTYKRVVGQIDGYSRYVPIPELMKSLESQFACHIESGYQVTPTGSFSLLTQTHLIFSLWRRHSVSNLRPHPNLPLR